MDNLYAKFHINSDASDEEIRKVYDALIKKYTSASYKGSQDAAEKNILKAKKIYDTLSDPKLRQEHDKANGINASNPYVYEKSTKSGTKTDTKATTKTTKATTAKNNTAKDSSAKKTNTKSNASKTISNTTSKTTDASSKTITKTASKTTSKTKTQAIDITITQEQLGYTLLTDKQRQKLASDISKLEKLIHALSINGAHLSHEELEKQNADYDKKLRRLQKKLEKDEKERLKKEIAAYDEHLKIYKSTSPVKTNSAKVKTVEISAVDVEIITIEDNLDISDDAVAETAATVADNVSSDFNTNTDTIIEVPPPAQNDFSSIFLINDEPPKKGKKSKKSKDVAEVVTQEIGIVETTELETIDNEKATAPVEDLHVKASEPSKGKAKSEKSKNKTNDISNEYTSDNEPEQYDTKQKQEEKTEQVANNEQPTTNKFAAKSQVSEIIEPKSEQDKQDNTNIQLTEYSDNSKKGKKIDLPKSIPADMSKKRMPRPAWLFINILVCLIVGISAYIATDGVYSDNFLGGIFIKTYSLEYSASEGGYIDGSVTQSVKEGSSGDSVYAKAIEGYIFIGWSDGQTDAKRTDANIGQNIAVTANFVKGIKVEYSAGENGYILGETTQYVLPGGDAQAIVAEGFNGYAFDYWIGQKDGEDYTDESAAREDKNITSTISLTAHFTQGIMLIYKAEEGGYISGKATQAVKTGLDGQTVVAEANIGFTFIGWSDDPQGTIGAERTDKSVQKDMIVYALFAPLRTLKYEAKIGGKINGVTTQTIIKDTDGNEVEAVAENGYKFIGWNDGITSPTRKDIADENKNIEAIFKKFFTLTYDVEVVSDIVSTEGFTVSRTTPQEIFIGEDALDVTAVCTADSHIFDYWKVNGVRDNVNAAAMRTDTDIQEDMTITAVFTKVLTVTYSVKLIDMISPGIITGIHTQTINYGKSANTVIAQTADIDRYEFSHWTINGEHDNINTFDTRTDTNITADMNIIAVFKKLYRFEYTVNDSNGGKINGKITQTVLEGTDGTEVEAVAKSGYRFIGWSDGNTLSTRTDLADKDKSFEAIFTQYFVVSYSIKIEPIILGDYYIDGKAEQTPLIGESTTRVMAICNLADYVFVYWEVNGVTDITNTTVTRTDTNITADMNIVAVFIKEYTVKYTANTGGKINNQAQTETELIFRPKHGESISTVKAIADDANEYAFDYWLVDGKKDTVNTTDEREDKNITSDIVIEAVFIKLHKVTYIAGTGGAISDGTDSGSELTFYIKDGNNAPKITASPIGTNEYVFDYWQEGTDKSNTTNHRTDSAITSNRTITAVFAKLHKVEYTVGTGGTLSDGSTSKTTFTYYIKHGEDVTKTITASPTGTSEYVFDYWQECTDKSNTTNHRTDSAITSNRTITAVFAKLHKVEYTVGTGGTLSDGSTSKTTFTYYIKHDEDVAKTITASPTGTNEYVFDYWQEGDDKSNTTNYRTDTAITANRTITAVFAKLHKVIYKAETGGILSCTIDNENKSESEFTFYIKNGTNAPAITTLTASEYIISGNKIYQFAKWCVLDDGNETSTTDEDKTERTDTNITAPVVYVAKFLYKGDGSTAYPFGIHDAAGLYKLNTNASDHFILCNDIDLDGIDFTPLCPTGFSGTLDGKKSDTEVFSIKNMSITSGSANLGLFAKLNDGAKVKNLSFINAKINVTSNSTINIGILVGYSLGQIESINVMGSISIYSEVEMPINHYIGGIVGQTANGTNSKLLDCTATVNIISTLESDMPINEYIGGIVGFNNRTDIINCSSTTTISLCGNAPSANTITNAITAFSSNSEIKDCEGTLELVPR